MFKARFYFFKICVGNYKNYDLKKNKVKLSYMNSTITEIRYLLYRLGTKLDKTEKRIT